VTIESDGKGWRVVSHQIAAGGPPAEKGRSKARREIESLPTDRAINVNIATQRELEALSGVGPMIARRIIEDRPYRSVDELERVEGIGKKRQEESRPLVSVE
jgi:DNA uptake protein ComE-like DNA-binding protein